MSGAVRGADPCENAADRYVQLEQAIDGARGSAGLGVASQDGTVVGTPINAPALAAAALAEHVARCVPGAAEGAGKRFTGAQGDQWWTRYREAQKSGQLAPLPAAPGTVGSGVEVDASMFTDGTGNSGRGGETLAEMCARLAPALGNPPLPGEDGLVARVTHLVPGEAADAGQIVGPGLIDLEAVRRDLAH